MVGVLLYVCYISARRIQILLQYFVNLCMEKYETKLCLKAMLITHTRMCGKIDL
jgi:hypothetical protein